MNRLFVLIIGIIIGIPVCFGGQILLKLIGKGMEEKKEKEAIEAKGTMKMMIKEVIEENKGE